MKNSTSRLAHRSLAFYVGMLGVAFSANTFGAAPPTIPIYSAPLFLTSAVPPNVLVVYDNSESMDAAMNGQLLQGDNVYTRSNIARSVMRTTITNYRTAFNWGLMSFAMSGNSLQNTYAYFMGDSGTGTTSMQFTDSCVVNTAAIDQSTQLPATTISALTPGLTPTPGVKCVPNPQPFAGGNYVSFSASGDDLAINDVLYFPASFATYTNLWGLSASGTSYYVYSTHNTTNSWTTADFNPAPNGLPLPGCSSNCTPWPFGATDSGFLASSPTVTRQLWLPRGWGYYADITGGGILNEAAQVDSTTHYNNLINLLATETKTATGEIKNGAVFTPLTGTLNTAKSYFAGSLSGQSSPIQYSCQKNFVMLVTDGLPTGKTDGTQYLYSQISPIATLNGTTWTYSPPGTDVINAVTSLKTTVKGGVSYDIPTYVVAVGDGIGPANAGAQALMNQMAIVGGTTSAIFANDQTTFQNAIQNIANDILSRTGAASSVALNTGTWTTTSSLYQAKFQVGVSNSDWYGQLLSFAINIDGTIAGTATWDGGTQINAQNYDSGRVILTIKPSSGAGIAFRWPVNPASPTTTELDATTGPINQVAALNTVNSIVDTQGAARLDYLRGSTSNVGTGNNYRPRPESKLGDIVNSAPYYIGPPAFNYSDSFQSAPYSTFYTTYKNRTPMVYVGANDGMLHGFNANTGAEKIAFVPSAVFPNLSLLTTTNYAHRWYVDGSPTVGDSFFGSAWHTMLVGGLRGGGRGVYALDITDPAAFSETPVANLSNIVKWEFDVNKDTTANDPDADATAQYALGYTFSQPSIVKMNNGKWAAIFGSGYNNAEPGTYQNANGYAVLYIIDISNGTVMRKINTQVGSCTVNGVTINNGLSTPAPVDVTGDGIADYIYAGDLCGNIWNFDVTSSTPSSWVSKYKSGTTPKPLWTAVDAAGNVQPIMVRPEVAKMPTSLGGVLVLLGTGLYLQSSDNASTAQQSFYGIWDKLPNSGTQPNISRSNLLHQTVNSTVTLGGNDYRITSDTITGSSTIPLGIDYSAKNGWYMDFPTAPTGFGAERQITDPVLSNGKIIFATSLPSSAVCSFGGDGWLMELDALSGSMLPYQVFDTNSDGLINTTDSRNGGRKIIGMPSSPGILGGAGGSSSSQLENKYMNLTSGTIQQLLEKSGGLGSGRVSWREIPQ
jgi:type IV pilus assembly protein PilY1